MSDNPYTDDEYDDTYEKVHGDEPARDEYTDTTTDDAFFPSGTGTENSLYPSNWGIWPAGDAVDATADEGTADTDDEDGGSWLGEGLIGTLLLVGVVLFVFPEPATSAVGIAMVAMGIVAWIADWAMS